MIRSLLLAFTIALLASVVAWFVIPASTYVENALGILMLVFAVTAVAVLIVHRILVWQRKNLTRRSTGRAKAAPR
jgi:hypothetical protein